MLCFINQISEHIERLVVLLKSDEAPDGAEEDHLDDEEAVEDEDYKIEEV